MTDPAATTAKVRKPAAPPTPLGKNNEATLLRLKKEVKAPGTEFGLLTRGIETDLRSLQDRLNARGSIVVPPSLGNGPGTPVKAGIDLDLHLLIGEGDQRNYAFSLLPSQLYEKEDTTPATSEGNDLAEGEEDQEPPAGEP